MPKILLIDDEELVVKSIERLLRKEGFEVVSKRSGQDAIQEVGKNDFDLIITDIRMPVMNGIDMISRIREVLRGKDRSRIPEICITGYADNELYQKAEQLQVADYLYKPFDLRDFLDCVRRHTQK